MKGLYSILAVVVVAALFAVRVPASAPLLPIPSIDESAVVQTAIGVMGGDFDYRFYKYGSVTAYTLAGLYSVMALATGRSNAAFAEASFFDPTEAYLAARYLGVGVEALLVVILFFGARRHFGRRAAAIGAALAALPLIDNLNQFTARVDVTLALFHTLAWLSALDVATRERRRDYALFGAWIGLALASKPLTGLLAVPVLFLARAIWLRGETDELRGWRRIRRVVGGTIFSPLVVWAVLAAVASEVAVNPYSLLAARDYLAAQVTVVGVDSKFSFNLGYDVARFLKPLGWPTFVIFVLGLVGAILRPTRRTVLVVGYVAIFYGAFAAMPTNIYFYAPVIPALCLLAGVALAAASRMLPGRWPPIAALTAVYAAAAAFSLHHVRARLEITRPGPARYTETLAASRARNWVEANIPTGESILYIGLYPTGPQLLADDPERLAAMALHFDLGRDRNEFLNATYRSAYERVRRAGRPAYRLTYLGLEPGSSWVKLGSLGIDDLEPASAAAFAATGVVPFCIRNGVRNVLVTNWGSRTPHSRLGEVFPWTAARQVAGVAHFRDRFGGETSIFRVEPSPPDDVWQARGVVGAKF